MPDFRSDPAPELERYELYGGPAYRFQPDRRDFFRLLGAGIAVCVALPESASAQESGDGRGGRGREGRSAEVPQDISAWLHIGEDSRITVFTGKVEVGQNSRTALTQAVCEELHTPPGSVQLVMGDTELTPFDMGTFGSRTTPTMAPQLRRAAIAARELLFDLASRQWQVERAGLRIENGSVTTADHTRSIRFGELTKGRNLVRTGENGSVDQPLGQSISKIDGRQMVTGAHRYASDLKRPGMYHGRVLRPDRFSASLLALDATPVEKFAGVKVVRDGDFAGVYGPDREVLGRPSRRFGPLGRRRPSHQARIYSPT